MPVAVKEVSRPHRKAANGYGDAHLHHVDVGVGNRNRGRKEVKAEGPHLLQVSNPAVRDRSDAAQGLVNISLNLPPEGPQPRRVVYARALALARRDDEA